MPRSGPMPIISASTQDLRSHAMDRKRDRETKSKWAPKWAPAYGSPLNVGTDDICRPRQHPRTQLAAMRDRQNNEKPARKMQQLKKRLALHVEEGIGGDTPDSSADELVAGVDRPVGHEEEDYKYSYDASRGPAEGNEILEMALTKAVKRFEDQETTKLVKNEYEFVDDEHVATSAHFGAADSDDDDFELV